MYVELWQNHGTIIYTYGETCLKAKLLLEPVEQVKILSTRNNVEQPLLVAMKGKQIHRVLWYHIAVVLAFY